MHAIPHLWRNAVGSGANRARLRRYATRTASDLGEEAGALLRAMSMERRESLRRYAVWTVSDLKEFTA